MNNCVVKSEDFEDDEINGFATPRRYPEFDYDNDTTIVRDAEPINCKREASPSQMINSNGAMDQGSRLLDPDETLVLNEEVQDADLNISEIAESGFSSSLGTSPETPQQPEVATHNGSDKNDADIVVKTENPDLSPEPSTRDNSIDSQGTIENNCAPCPKISIVPTHRLRVKAEFSVSEVSSANDLHDTSAIPENFFDDLLTMNVPSPPTRMPDESIPENFFDDLLVDHVKERIEQAVTVELEEKYSDRLKLLQELENEERSQEKKKPKRSKRKSRKRSRSPRSPSCSPPRPRSRERNHRSPSPKPMHNKRTRADLSPPSTSGRYRCSRPSGINEDNIFEENSRENVPLIDKKPPKRILCAEDVELLDGAHNSKFEQPHLPEIGPHLTPKQKKERSLIRAKTLLSYLKESKTASERPIAPFLFTSTVRKLPSSHSYRRQQIYENRSVLHTINNVRYKFNSHSSQFNFEEWGLASLPPLSANIAKLVGFSADAVHEKLKVSKIPDKIRNVKSEGQEEDESFLQSKASLYCNAATQTDEVVEILPIKAKGYDIGVQVTPASYEIACQTLETEAPSVKRFDNNDDLPIMSVMRKLNENQLLALHDFAELLTEPACNAMDMYRLRQRMLDIYKCSQLPSALANPAPASVNSYTSNAYSSLPRQSDMQQQNSAGRIQVVSSSDGHRYSNNDSRTKYTDARSHSIDEYDPRNHSLSQGFSRPDNASQINFNSHAPHHLNRPPHLVVQQNLPPGRGAARYYGRGGLRR